jgi:hypothetical protein
MAAIVNWCGYACGYELQCCSLKIIENQELGYRNAVPIAAPVALKPVKYLVLRHFSTIAVRSDVLTPMGS